MRMATHSSVLAWRIPGTAEPGWLLSMGLHRVGHDWSDLAAAVAEILTEVESEKYKCHMISLICGIKNKWHELIYKTETHSHRK